MCYCESIAVCNVLLVYELQPYQQHTYITILVSAVAHISQCCHSCFLFVFLFIYVCVLRLLVIANGNSSLIVVWWKRCPGWCKVHCIDAKVSVSDRIKVHYIKFCYKPQQLGASHTVAVATPPPSPPLPLPFPLPLSPSPTSPPLPHTHACIHSQIACTDYIYVIHYCMCILYT